MFDTLLRSTDSPVTGAGDDNVAIAANEVTATKHNNDSSSSLVGETVSHADNDRKKNGSIGEARENYKFDVSRHSAVSSSLFQHLSCCATAEGSPKVVG